LPQRPERTVDDVLLYLYGSGILTIEYVEELKQRLDLHALRDVESLRDAHIQIDKRRTRKRISPRAVIDRIERPVAVRIFERQRLPAIVKSALRPENSAELKLPRQLH
jgi:hypothetical protein